MGMKYQESPLVFKNTASFQYLLAFCRTARHNPFLHYPVSKKTRFERKKKDPLGMAMTERMENIPWPTSLPNGRATFAVAALSATMMLSLAMLAARFFLILTLESP